MVAESVVGNAVGKGQRRKLNKAELSPGELFPWFHGWGWGEPKMGKTHLGLDARSHEIRTPGTGGGMRGDRIPGEILIPSKPLAIGYANFDRKATTVLLELPDDVDIEEEPLYLDANGEPIFFIDDRRALSALLNRFIEFTNDVKDTVDLIVADGGTIVWGNVRNILLPDPAGRDADGNPHHLPRQYGPANDEMRAQIMQRLYNLPVHTWITTEAREKWSSASKPDEDATGNAVLQPDGWNKTGYYVDVGGQVKLADVRDPKTKQMVKQRWFESNVSTKPQMIGQVIVEPTFADIYRRTFPQVPLLRREDRELFMKLQAEHGGKLEW